MHRSEYLGLAELSVRGGNREQGTGNREQGTGNREQGTGNREQGNFTFRYLCRFFSVYLLS
ncbi:hypothetical protein IQ222_06305 [Dolichospermum flos-aquae LEGE 04289]|uniref:Uncharacterized protein n=1 Tax=Dolichospermum flos-aquae LEGE 04289 TaxID=1828708 RepID=A0ACC5PZE3_DOLFA|nr:hypothetical protein [Dolichospermum flos-aquae LEGE 04289]